MENLSILANQTQQIVDYLPQTHLFVGLQQDWVCLNRRGLINIRKSEVKEGFFHHRYFFNSSPRFPFPFFFPFKIYLFIFGCVGSLLLHGLSPGAESRGYSLVNYIAHGSFSLRWLFLLWSTSFRSCSM